MQFFPKRLWCVEQSIWIEYYSVCMCKFFYFFSLNHPQSELMVGWMCSAKRAQWAPVFETWWFYYENVLSSLLREVILLMSLWLNYNWQLPKTRCFPAFEFQNLCWIDVCLKRIFKCWVCRDEGPALAPAAWHYGAPDYGTGGDMSAWNTTPWVSMFWGQRLQ